MHKRYFDKKNGFFLLIGFLITSLFFSTESLARDRNIEYKIKAGYLYNFTKFVTWPGDDLATFNICILGKDPFGSIINSIETRSVEDKPIRLFRFKSISEIQQCHIVYFGKSRKKWGKSDLSLKSVLTISSDNKTLSVSESKKFTKAGGMIAFFRKKGKIKLHINLQALRKSGLEVSAKLLEVAEVYEGESND